MENYFTPSFVKKARVRVEIGMWEQMSSLPLWIVNRWHDFKLCSLLSYTYMYIPYYQQWAKKQKVRFQRGVKCLSILPIVDKQYMLYNGILNFSDPKWRNFARRGKTSGSTGVPFAFFSKQFPSPVYNNFLAYKSLIWAGISLEEIMQNQRIVRIRMAPFVHPARLFIPVSEFMRDPIASMKRINAFKGDIIESYPTILVMLSRLVETTGVPLNFKYCFSYGEMLYPAQRELIEHSLGCKIYNRYGLEEFGSVAIECEKHNGFHINTEAFIVEIVDSRGCILNPGQKGKIIVTDLYNFVMPFLRYDTGDYGFISEAPCSCGINSPILYVDGRHGAIIKLPGRLIHHFEIAEIFQKFGEAVLQYQLIVHTGFVEVNVIPGPAGTHEKFIQLQNSLQQLFTSELPLRIVLAPVIHRLPNGKSQIIIQQDSKSS